MDVIHFLVVVHGDVAGENIFVNHWRELFGLDLVCGDRSDHRQRCRSSMRGNLRYPRKRTLSRICYHPSHRQLVETRCRLLCTLGLDDAAVELPF